MELQTFRLMYAHDAYTLHSSVVDGLSAYFVVPLCEKMLCVSDVSFQKLVHMIIE